jgi:hypothetical protein
MLTCQYYNTFTHINKALERIGFQVRKKIIVVIITFLLDIFLSGCVSNTLPEKTSPVSLQPKVEIGIEKYSPNMSSVPGYPFVCKGDDIASVLYSVDNGVLLLWGPDDFRVRPQGKEVTVKAGVSVYWSPFVDSQKLATSAIIIANITMPDKTVYVQKISIDQTLESGSAYFKAKHIQ